MRESLTAGISVLVGVTVVVLGCFGRFFFSLARRSREAAQLVREGPPMTWNAPGPQMTRTTPTGS
jgi:hypothetical protein